MDSRTDFQRLLEEMDRALRRKQQELAELDERLEAAREQLSEKEAKEMLEDSADHSPTTADATNEADQLKQQRDFEELMQEQRNYYERQVANLTEELIELEASHKNLTKVNERLQFEVDSLKVSNEKLRTRTQTISEHLDEVQSANFELNIRLAKSESQSQMQQKLLKKSHEQDQILMNAFNSKLESLKEAISVRDQEIRRLRLDNQLTLESLGIRMDEPAASLVAVGDGGQFNEHYRDRQQQRDTDTGAAPVALGSSGDLMDTTSKQRFITNLIRDKDAQILQLNEQLIEATRELENNSSLIETLTNERLKSRRASGGGDKDNANDDNDGVPIESRPKFSAANVTNGTADECQKCRMLEVELSEKDKQLHWIVKRNHHFESILPSKIVELIEQLSSRRNQTGELMADSSVAQATGDNSENNKRVTSLSRRLAESLEELLNELSSSQRLMDTIDQLQRVISSRDEHIRRLVRELNEMSARINNDHQIDALAVTKMDVDEVTGRPQQTITQSSRAEQSLVNQQATSLTGEGDHDHDMTAINEEQSEGQKGCSLGTHGEEAACKVIANLESRSDENNAAAESETTPNVIAQRTGENDDESDGQIRETNSNGYDDSNERDPISQPTTTNSDSRQLPAPTSSMQRRGTAPPNRDSSKLEQAFIYQNRLRQLENENQLLELAMKEILLSIKWSDTRCSTILIDCPSLERLCQLIEARYIANSSVRQAGPLMPIKDDGGHSQETEPKENICASDRPSGDQLGTNCDLFQMVVMKSELDLLRGQNEQLRSELKLQRRDWRYSQSQMASSNGHDEPIGHEHNNHKTERKIPFDGATLQSGATCEIECQTDSLILIDPQHFGLTKRMQVESSLEEERERSSSPMTLKRKEKCQNCFRLVRLANHLLDCIVRIEARVNSSDESNISKLLALYQLTQRLSKDLSSKDAAINQLRRDCHFMGQQKVLAETRLKSIENHLEIHNRMCPLNHCLPTRKEHQTHHYQSHHNKAPTTNIHMSTKTRNGRSQLVHSLTIRSEQEQVEVPLRDSRVTIALLKSIIGCLQARLDYKDERLNQLEQMLVAAN